MFYQYAVPATKIHAIITMHMTIQGTMDFDAHTMQ